MKARIFNTGDKVQHIRGGEIMTVERYATNYRPLMGWEEHDLLVICIWKDEMRIHREIIDQSELNFISDENMFHHHSEHLLWQKEHGDLRN
ncbi:MAG: hypothetical protein HKN39_08715 [Flavobacteriales bacterium]|nr:hypothetical protein [Flavobacteriales bacterium]